MNLPADGFTLEALIGLAGIFMGLAIAVQVLQEIYKYVTWSKARAYRIALRDFLGDWVDKAYGCEALRSMYVRGPFELVKSFFRKLLNLKRKKSAAAGLLPLTKEDLLHAVDRTAPDWVRDVIDVLKKERDLQQGTSAPPSPVLGELIDDVWTRYACDTPARKTFDFLVKWKVTGQPKKGSKKPLRKSCDAARVLEAFYQRYVPERAKVNEEFEQFTANFEHTYQRRNFRQTLMLATLLSLLLGLPFSALYNEARSLAPEEAIRVTQSLSELHDESQADPEKAAELNELLQRLREPLEQILEPQELDLGRGVARLRELVGTPKQIPGYLGHCLLTALLIAFGAPFWDRLSKALLSFRGPRPAAAESAEGETKP